MIESAVEKHFCECVARFGGVAYKWVSPGRRGVPDRLVVMPNGRIVFVELKRPKGGVLGQLQKLQLRRLIRLGCDCYWARTTEQAAALALFLAQGGKCPEGVKLDYGALRISETEDDL